MHMADALISPAVGGVMGLAATGLVAHCARKVREEPDELRVPLMGAMGAFVFAVQMINFTIPGTGSSGHLGGGLLLAIALGPPAAFLVMTSVLAVQALFFADGGLLALGCNVVNLAFFPCFVAYPLVYRRIVGDRPTRGRVMAGSLAGAVVGLQLGSIAVALETWISGVSELPLGTFLLLMQSIHLPIGIVEGLATAAVALFVARARPEILAAPPLPSPARSASRTVLAGIAVAAILSGGALSWFASTRPDGLEWAVERTAPAGIEEPGGAHALLSGWQERLSILPEYGFAPSRGQADADPGQGAWPAVDGGTSLAGIVGSGIVLAAALVVGLVLARRRRAGP